MFEFGQVPIFELKNGTKMAQTTAILNYLGRKYKMVPDDPLAAYNGEAFSEHTLRDFWQM